MNQEFLLLLGLGAGAWWWWQNHGGKASTTAPSGDDTSANATIAAAKKTLYSFLNSNYHLPASVDPHNLAASGIDPTVNTAVPADTLPTDPPFPAGTNILVYTSALPQLNAMIITAGGKPLSNTVSGGGSGSGSGGPSSADVTAAKAAMDAFLAPLQAAPAGYNSGDSFNGIAIVRAGKIVPNTIYQQWQLLHSALQQVGQFGYGV